MNVEKILIIKTSAIGDILQAFDVMDYLYKKFVGVKIDWVVEEKFKSLVQAHPYINCAIGVDTSLLRKKGFSREGLQYIKEFRKRLQDKEYDLVFDLQGNIKSGIITFLSRGKEKVGFGWKTAREKLNVLATHKRVNPCFSLNMRQFYLRVIQAYFQDQELFISDRICLKFKEKRELRAPHFFMIALGSRWENKRIDFNTAVSFLKQIVKEYDPVFLFIWGSQKEREEAEKLALLFPKSKVKGNLSFSLWQQEMEESRVLICVDSAALHLCGMTNTPSFSIFGPSLAAVYKPEGKRHFAFQGKCPYHKSFIQRCPLLRTCATGACLKEIQAEDLFENFKQWYAHYDNFSSKYTS